MGGLSFSTWMGKYVGNNWGIGAGTWFPFGNTSFDFARQAHSNRLLVKPLMNDTWKRRRKRFRRLFDLQVTNIRLFSKQKKKHRWRENIWRQIAREKVDHRRGVASRNTGRIGRHLQLCKAFIKRFHAWNLMVASNLKFKYNIYFL